MNTEKKIAVIGDIMLDKHIECKVTGISPEDDIAPKLHIQSIRMSPGGAANVANNIVKMGCAVDLFSCIGNDNDGELLVQELHKNNINNHLLKLDRPTTTKSRYITTRGRHVARIDNEENTPITYWQIRPLLDKISNYDVVVVSDYDKGVVTSCVMEYLNSTGSIIIVDPKKNDLTFYGPVFIITPNSIEAQRAHKRNKRIQAHANFLLITNSGHGCELIPKHGGAKTTFSVRKRETGDPTGCGDSFIAGLATQLSYNAPLHHACQYAAAAGACAVDHLGVYAVSNKEVLHELEQISSQYTTTNANDE